MGLTFLGSKVWGSKVLGVQGFWGIKVFWAPRFWGLRFLGSKVFEGLSFLSLLALVCTIFAEFLRLR